MVGFTEEPNIGSYYLHGKSHCYSALPVVASYALQGVTVVPRASEGLLGQK